MNLRRRMAVGVSAFLAEHVSAGSREWADGLAREVEVIDGDWAALGWALGGLRVLVRRPEAKLVTLEQLPAAAGRLQSEVRSRTITGAGIALVEFAAFSYYFVEFHTTTMRIGSAFTAAATIWFAHRMLAQRANRMGCAKGIETARTYRAELERQRNFHTLGQLLLLQAPMLVGVLLFCAGMGTAHPWTAKLMAGTYLAILASVALAAWGYRGRVAGYQRKIDELDELLKTAN